MYSRLILAGDGILQSYVSETADAYRFDDDMDLTYDEVRCTYGHAYHDTFTITVTS